jgi:hypothetical protein
VRLIFQLLQTAPWAGLFSEKYASDKTLFLRDLTNPPLQENGPRPLLPSLFLDACLQAPFQLCTAALPARWFPNQVRVIVSEKSLLRLASDDAGDTNELACSFLWKDGYYFETLFQQLLSSDCSQITRVRSCFGWDVLVEWLTV